jgi:hypothetical protein
MILIIVIKKDGRGGQLNAILTYGINTGIIIRMTAAKKVTVHLPEDLLARAQESTGQGITETIRRGLQLIAASESYEKLRSLRGKVKLSIDTKRLREDRG